MRKKEQGRYQSRTHNLTFRESLHLYVKTDSFTDGIHKMLEWLQDHAEGDYNTSDDARDLLRELGFEILQKPITQAAYDEAKRNATKALTEGKPR